MDTKELNELIDAKTSIVDKNKRLLQKRRVL
jgi:hypothetical protein